MVASAAAPQLKSHFWITTCSCRISRMDLTGLASAVGAPPPKERAIHANHAKRKRAPQLLPSTIVEFLRFLLLTDNKRSANDHAAPNIERAVTGQAHPGKGVSDGLISGRGISDELSGLRCPGAHDRSL